MWSSVIFVLFIVEKDNVLWFDATIATQEIGSRVASILPDLDVFSWLTVAVARSTSGAVIMTCFLSQRDE